MASHGIAGKCHCTELETELAQKYGVYIFHDTEHCRKPIGSTKEPKFSWQSEFAEDDPELNRYQYDPGLHRFKKSTKKTLIFK